MSLFVRRWLLLIFLGFFVESIQSECPPCDKDAQCKNEPLASECTAGITADACGCCNICARDVGEPCGGKGNALGSCASGLVCTTISPRQPARCFQTHDEEPHQETAKKNEDNSLQEASQHETLNVKSTHIVHCNKEPHNEENSHQEESHIVHIHEKDVPNHNQHNHTHGNTSHGHDLKRQTRNHVGRIRFHESQDQDHVDHIHDHGIHIPVNSQNNSLQSEISTKHLDIEHRHDHVNHSDVHSNHTDHDHPPHETIQAHASQNHSHHEWDHTKEHPELHQKKHQEHNHDHLQSNHAHPSHQEGDHCEQNHDDQLHKHDHSEHKQGGFHLSPIPSGTKTKPDHIHLRQNSSDEHSNLGQHHNHSKTEENTKVHSPGTHNLSSKVSDQHHSHDENCTTHGCSHGLLVEGPSVHLTLRVHGRHGSHIPEHTNQGSIELSTQIEDVHHISVHEDHIHDMTKNKNDHNSNDPNPTGKAQEHLESTSDVHKNGDNGSDKDHQQSNDDSRTIRKTHNHEGHMHENKSHGDDRQTHDHSSSNEGHTQNGAGQEPQEASSDRSPLNKGHKLHEDHIREKDGLKIEDTDTLHAHSLDTEAKTSHLIFENSENRNDNHGSDHTRPMREAHKHSNDNDANQDHEDFLFDTAQHRNDNRGSDHSRPTREAHNHSHDANTPDHCSQHSHDHSDHALSVTETKLISDLNKHGRI